MDILMKYAKENCFYFIDSFVGIVIIVFNLKIRSTTSSNVNINDINELAGTIGSMVTIIQIIFIYLLYCVVTAILNWVYFFKKISRIRDAREFIVSCINSILLLLSMSGINAICKILRVAISGDYSSYDYEFGTIT